MNSSEKHIDEEQMPEAVREKLAAKRRRKRIIFAALGALPFVLIGWWLWSNSAGDRAIQAEIDRYRAAGQPIYPADFDPAPTPDDNNAALALKNAFAALDMDLDADRYEFAICCSPKKIAKRHDDFTQIIKTNSEIFELVRQARSMTGADWGIRLRSPMINTLLPSLSGQRQLAKFLCSAAIYHHQTGNDAEAVEVLHDALAAAGTVRKIPVLVGFLVATAEDALACSVIEDIIVDLQIRRPDVVASASPKAASRKQIQALIKDLLAEEELCDAARLAFYSERACVFDTAMLVLDGRMDFSSIGISSRPGLNAVEKTGVLKPFLKEDTVRMLRYMTAQAEAAGQTNWPEAKQKMPEAFGVEGFWAGLTHAFSRSLLPTLTRTMKLGFQTRAMRRMSAVALAIRLYEIDNGSRPAKLADLVPKYIPAVPDDPFDNPGQPLRYLPNAQRPILYSIGSDEEDDCGTWGEDPNEPLSGTSYMYYDIPFFLNGDRPSDEEEEEEPATQPTSAPRPTRRRRHPRG